MRCIIKAECFQGLHEKLFFIQDKGVSCNTCAVLLKPAGMTCFQKLAYALQLSDYLSEASDRRLLPNVPTQLVNGSIGEQDLCLVYV